MDVTKDYSKMPGYGGMMGCYPGMEPEMGMVPPMGPQMMPYMENPLMQNPMMYMEYMYMYYKYMCKYMEYLEKCKEHNKNCHCE